MNFISTLLNEGIEFFEKQNKEMRQKESSLIIANSKKHIWNWSKNIFRVNVMLVNVFELLFFWKAYRVVDEVFDRCYNDLEPFGRRIRNLEDCQRAYDDRKRFGFD